MIRSICNNFVHDMQNTCFQLNDYLALLCGSSIVEDDPRDTDIFIYTKEDERVFSQKLLYEFSRIDAEAKFAYLGALRFYSLKYNSNGIHYSIHIVLKRRLLWKRTRILMFLMSGFIIKQFIGNGSWKQNI